MIDNIGAVDALIDHLRENIGDDPAWRPALHELETGQAPLHLAVLVEPFLGWLLEGTKTIESRFSRVRCAPWGVLHEGHIVVAKKTGGPVVGAFQAGQVRSYQLTPQQVTELRSEFAAQICATDDNFWNQRADTRYATLVDAVHARTLPDLPFPKRDRRGWVVLTERYR